jgi:uncharacterized membrane protein
MSEIAESSPPKMKSPENDLVRQTELLISGVLRAGVLLSAAVIAIGVLDFYRLYFFFPHDVALQSGFPHSFGGVISSALSGNPKGIIASGLLILLLTPVVRVAVSILAFAVERDWRYVVITFIVLAILIISFILGRGGA